MTAIERLVVNGNNIITLLKDFFSETPKEVTIDWLNNDGTSTTRTFKNARMYHLSINMRNIDGMIVDNEGHELLKGEGPVGPAGAKGEQGCPGERGVDGEDGPTGATGAKGDIGETGPIGDTGDKGETGDKGDTGDTGTKGDTGEKGTTGDSGTKGDTGDKGVTGDKGDPGAVGSAVPVGTVVSTAEQTIPSGFFTCDGTELSKVTYPDLFAVIGYTFGGSGNVFNIPDLRGKFIRMVGGNAGLFGEEQGNMIQSHRHRIRAMNNGAMGGNGVRGYRQDGTYGGDTGSAIETTGGIETRPINIALNYIIKY